MHTLRPTAHESKSKISTTKACNKSIPLVPLHPQHSPLILTQKMAPSSNQLSSTATPTDPNLHLSTTPQSNSHLPAIPTMNSHTPSPPAHTQEMVDLEQIWSGLSLEHLHDETMSFFRIPVHPQTAMLWNQVSQTATYHLSCPTRTRPGSATWKHCTASRPPRRGINATPQLEDSANTGSPK